MLEILICGQIGKGDTPKVADRLEGTTFQSAENQGCNLTVPRSEGSSRDQHNTEALEGNIRDELSLVGLPNPFPQEAQEISSPQKPILENLTLMVNPESPLGPGQAKQPKGKANWKRIARNKVKQAQ